ncbi:major facilitator superfamily MFS_1 [Kribbella flavida DSM 17836]|uniref:Major facilitator superfamily MFS_1 n=1 Tax=Kribbella flavida (strain DSM 17836 / JCM 10339 / NBRC 14399) TaxID=479435 RepID=D2PUZ9_KRIFD|nr:MFS transporter [Kribbella flavida]ADB31465.1 major facilitator superfamily MFS_1 [Kribbella flavida DSM 17836]
MKGVIPAPGPLRALALATLLSRIGSGLLMTVSVLYFTRIVGLSVAEVGVGLTVAGLFGLLSAVPLGHLADRRGPRGLFVLLSCTVALLSLLYLLVDSFWQFLVVAVIVTVLDRGTGAVRAALIAAVTQGSERVAARAYLRAVTNIGVMAGAGIGALALHYDTRTAYQVMFVLDTVLTCTSALFVLAVPRVAPQPRSGDGPVWIALRDRGYLAVAALNAAMSIHYAVLDVAIPLWVVEHTEAPRWTVALLLIINTVVVALFQVRSSRGIQDPLSAARATRTAGLLLMASMVLFAGASGGGAVVAVALLAVGALVQVIGELLQSSGSFLLGFDLASDAAQGQYQGVWNTSMSISTMVAPTVLALLPLGLGVPGWIILGGWFALVGVLFVPVVRWAAARRPVPAAQPAAPQV